MPSVERSENFSWQRVLNTATVKNVAGVLWRFVESQEQVATNNLVDKLAEQALLEELLEGTKPVRPPGTERLHYLLMTPFRYPPLKWGSRFGRRFEPSLFYGAQRIETALAETAYYRYLFWAGMEIPPSSGKLITQHTLFSAEYRAHRGLQLQHPPFSDYSSILVHPSDYAVTQELGTLMRENGIEAFEYPSARDPVRGINVALFIPDALASSKPIEQQNWICDTRAEQVTFRGPDRLIAFQISDFMVNGILPQPA